MAFQSVLKSLFAHLLILCLLSAIAAGVAATVFYHSYRQNVLSDRQAVELSNTAQTMAPLVIRGLVLGCLAVAKNAIEGRTIAIKEPRHV